jgi:hypothetical protein
MGWRPRLLRGDGPQRGQAKHNLGVARGIALATGDPQATGLGPDLIIQVSLEPGLSSQDFTQLLADFSARLGESNTLTERVDNLLVRVLPTPT